MGSEDKNILIDLQVTSLRVRKYNSGFRKGNESKVSTLRWLSSCSHKTRSHKKEHSLLLQFHAFIL